MAVFLQAPHHVGAHTPQTDHSELHSVCSLEIDCRKKCRTAKTISYRPCATAFARACRPDFRFLPTCTRSARRPRSARTPKSPRACAAFTIPKVYFCPGTARSDASSQVICRKTPLFGPPLYAWPVECRKRGPNPRTVATRLLSRTA